MLIREDDSPCVREAPSIEMYEGNKIWFPIEGLLKDILNRPEEQNKLEYLIPR